MIDILQIGYDSTEFLEKAGIIAKIKPRLNRYKRLSISYLNVGDKKKVYDNCKIDRILFEDDKRYREEKFLNIMEEISLFHYNISNRKMLSGTIPIPYSVLFGYVQNMFYKLDNNKIFSKIKIESKRNKKTFDLKLYNNIRKTNNKSLNVFIGESKKDSNSEWDFSITYKDLGNNEISGWCFDLIDFKERLKELFFEIGKIDVEDITFEIISSPSVAFILGQFLCEKKYEYKIMHWYEREKLNKVSVSIQNATIKFI